MEQNANNMNSTDTGAKKFGRPTHPAWEHFMRGEKRNRFHHHAYCKYCVHQHGIDSVQPIRGVSVNMLRHLEKCVYCPDTVVPTLRMVCEKKDAENFQKRHNTTPSSGSAGVLIGSGGLKKKRKDHSSIDDSMDIGGNSLMGTPFSKNRKKNMKDSLKSMVSSGHKRAKSITPMTLTPMFLRASVSAQLPFNWMENEEVRRIFNLLYPGISLPSSSNICNSNLMRSVATNLAEKQLERIKEDPNGVTLSISTWKNVRNQNILSFNLLNTHTEACTVALFDMGPQPYTSDDLSLKIDQILTQLVALKVNVIAIVSNSLNCFVASRRVNYATHPEIITMPCFFSILGLLTGIILTHEDFSHLVGDIIEVSTIFTYPTVVNLIRSQFPELQFPDVCFLPNRVKWSSFLLCIFNLKKFEGALRELASQSPAHHHHHSHGLQSDLLINCVRGEILSLLLSDHFWKRVNSLYHLTMPLKESYEVFLNSSLSNDATSNANLCHVVYQLQRLRQEYAREEEEDEEEFEEEKALRTHLLETVEEIWKMYELPIMVLSYVFQFKTPMSAIDTSQLQTQWLSIGKYVKAYYQRWFSTRDTDEESANSSPSHQDSTSANNSSSNSLLTSRITQDIHAYKERRFPFDLSTTNDYENVVSFYSFLSDAHPEFSRFCARLFSMSPVTARLEDVLPGIGYTYSSSSKTAHTPSFILPALQIGFSTVCLESFNNFNLHNPTSSAESGGNTNSANHSALLMGIMNGASGNPLHSASSTGTNMPQSSEVNNCMEGYSSLIKLESMANNDGSTFLFSQQSCTGLGHNGMFSTCGTAEKNLLETIWNREEWELVANQWRKHISIEMKLEDFEMISQLTSDSLCKEALPLSQVFKLDIPSLIIQHDEFSV